MMARAAGPKAIFRAAQTLALLALLGLAAACSSPGARQEAIPAAPLPTFDLQRSQSELQAGRSAWAAGEVKDATMRFKASLDAWPANGPAWEALFQAYNETGTDQDRNYTLFFLDRIDWAEAQHPLTAAMAFDLFASGQTDGAKTVRTSRIQNMAKRMSQLYRWRELGERGLQPAAKKPAVQKYGIYPIIFVGMVGAGYVTYAIIGD